ncbi:hypothetical protein ACSSZE_11190 [Acidithiobacillus caldus]
MDLSGLLRLADGLQSLASFDKDGDYGIFIPILEQGGLPAETVSALKKASYYENILNVGETTGQLRLARIGLETATLRPEAELILPIIRERLSWLEESKQFQKQIRLARSALGRRDYLRSTLYAFEAVITKLCLDAHTNVQDHKEREKIREDYESRKKIESEQTSYRLLKDLRNQVAHGTRGSRGEVQQALLDEERMRETLSTLLDKIEKGELPSAQH